MQKKSISLQGIAIAIVAMCAIAAFIKTVRNNDPPAPIPFVLRRYDIHLLSAEIGAPGKVVQAVKEKHVIARYTCTAQDAAVVWLYDDAFAFSQNSSWASGSDMPEIRYITKDLPAAEDEHGRPLPYSEQQTGSLIRIVFPRGYSRKPAYVLLREPVGLESHQSPQPTRVIKLDQFAEPVRTLTPPKPGGAQEAESGYRAVCKATNEQYPFVQIEDNAHRTAAISILSSSFCPDGPNPPIYFGDETDAVKIRFKPSIKAETNCFLLYKNAQVAIVNGVRLLRFPTTQDVGYVLDAKATIRKSMPVSNQKGPHAAAIGELLVALEKRPHPPADGNAEASFANISPSVEELGLDLLRFRIGDITSGEDIRGHVPSRSAPTMTIPELKIGVHIVRWTPASSKTVVLPVHHLAENKPRLPRLVQSQSPMPVSGPFPRGNGARKPTARKQMPAELSMVGHQTMPKFTSVFLSKDEGRNGGGGMGISFE